MLLGLLLAGATIGLHVDELGEVPPDLRRAVIETVSRAIEARTGLTPVIDEVSGGCLTQNCVAEIRSRTESVEVALLRLIAGPLSLRLSIERIAAHASSVGDKSEADLPRKTEDLAAPIEALVARVFPPRRAEKVVSPPVTPPPAERSNVAPIVLIAAGGAFVVTGAVLGLTVRSSGDDLAASPRSAEEFRSTAAGASRNALFANLLFAGAAGLLITGVGLLLAR